MISPRQESTSTVGNIGTGNVTVANVIIPNSATLRKGGFGSGSYYLDVPVGHIEFANKTGRPVIAYDLELDMGNISYNQESVYFVGPDTGNQINLSLKREAFPPGEVHERQYRGTITIIQRANNTNRILAQENITVEVQG